MAEQSFKNHTKWDPLFHFFLAPLMLATIAFSAKHAATGTNAAIKQPFGQCPIEYADFIWI